MLWRMRMEDRLSRLEVQLEQLVSRVAAFEQRLAALESRAGSALEVRAIGAPTSGELDGEAGLACLRKSDLATIVAATR